MRQFKEEKESHSKQTTKVLEGMYIMYKYDMWTVMFSFRYTSETK